MLGGMVIDVGSEIGNGIDFCIGVLVYYVVDVCLYVFGVFGCSWELSDEIFVYVDGYGVRCIVIDDDLCWV